MYIFNELSLLSSCSCWSSDVHLSDFPTLIKIRFCHNHPVDAAAALRHRDVSESTRLKIEKLLESYRPSTALEMFKFDLQLENPDTYVYMCGDRAQCPDLSYVYRYIFYCHMCLFLCLIIRFNSLTLLPG